MHFLIFIPTRMYILLLAGMLMDARAAHALTALEDSALAAVSGQGVAFNFNNLSLSGGLSLTFSGNGSQSVGLADLAFSRGDDPAATFSDPYRLEVQPSAAGLPDILTLTQPANASKLLGWQFAYDWSTFDGGSMFNGGALVVEDFQSHGGSTSLRAPGAAEPEAIIWGKAIQFDIGSLALRPLGRDNQSEQLLFSGVYLGAGGQPWTVADVTTQPGTFRAVSENGNAWLELEIDWPSSGQAPVGELLIDNISFQTSAPNFINPASGLPATSFSLGSSRIGHLQLQYLNVQLRPGT